MVIEISEEFIIENQQQTVQEKYSRNMYYRGESGEANKKSFFGNLFTRNHYFNDSYLMQIINLSLETVF